MESCLNLKNGRIKRVRLKDWKLEQTKHLKALKLLIQSLTYGDSKQEFLDNVVNVLRLVTTCEFIGIRVLDEKGYIPYQSYVGFSRQFWEQENLIQISRENCSCTRIIVGNILPCDQAIINKAGSMCCNDSTAYAQSLTAEEQTFFRGVCVAAGYRSIGIVPILYRNKVRGVIHLADLQPNKISNSAMAFVEMVAPLVGEVLERDKIEQAEKNVQQANRQLAEAFSQVQQLNIALEEEISERQSAEEALEKYRLFFRHSRDIMMFIDFSNQKIVEVNPAAEAAYGYSRDELLRRRISDLRLESDLVLLQDQLHIAGAQGIIFETFHRRADGSVFPVEVTAQGKMLGGRKAVFSVVRDITARQAAQAELHRLNNGLETMVRQRTLELEEANAMLEEEIGERVAAEAALQQLNGDLEEIVEQRTQAVQDINNLLGNQIELAEKVQRSLLPPDYQDNMLTIRTVYQPVEQVSGDFYGYRRSRDKNLLHGYLLDITGHGLATALYTSAVSTMLNEAMEEEEPWRPETLNRLNRYLYRSFQDDIFAAMLVFTLDLRQRQLTVSSFGINYVLSFRQMHSEIVKIPGMYLGVANFLEFETISMPVQRGDRFYFLTDGIMDELPEQLVNGADQFEATVAALRELSRGKIRDDCSALCIALDGFKPYPLYLNYSKEAERTAVFARLREILQQEMGCNCVKLEIVLGEALMNAVRHGKSIRVKINRINRHLLFRIKDDGPGFAANLRIQTIRQNGIEQEFECLQQSEGGRGILLMLSWMDKVLYNRQGNEVLLIKKIDQKHVV